MKKYYRKLIRDIYIIVRNQTICKEYDLLLELKYTPKQAKQRLIDKKYIDTDGVEYYLSESAIENIIYPREVVNG